jgi:transcriptional regulator with GAF, ATPase, and Fis domain/tetratricopeptide (TPR) repeat protein
MFHVSSLTQGQVLGARYRVLRALGRGGMASAYLVVDLRDGDEVALKLLEADELEQHFWAELEVLRGIHHPCLPDVRALGRLELGGSRRAYYVADYIEGGSLREHVARVGPRRALLALRDALSGLSLLHRLGVRHGDVKPDNVLVRADGRGVLIDLGCAAPLGARSDTPSGTLAYMAPELARGECADARTDLYAVGIMLRELFADVVGASTLEALCKDDPDERPTSVSDVIAALALPPLDDALPFTFDRRLVGRDQELARLRSALTRAHGRLSWVFGPSGSGRTRLVRELGWEASRTQRLLEVGHGPAELRRVVALTLAHEVLGLSAWLDAIEALAKDPTKTLLVLDDEPRLDAADRADLEVLLRVLPASGNLHVVLTSDRPAPHGLEGVVQIELGPLPAVAVEALSKDLVPPRFVEALGRLSSGYPRDLLEALGRLARGSLSLSELDTAHASPSREQRTWIETALASLDHTGRRVLGRIALGADTRADTVPEAVWSTDLLVREGSLCKLRRASFRDAIVDALGTKLCRALHREIAAALRARTDARGAALCIEHLVRAGQVDEALSHFRSSLPLARATPRPFLSVAHLLGPEHADAALEASAIARACGEPRVALEKATAVLATRPGPVLEARARLEAAEALLALGNPARAARLAARTTREASLLATALDLRARAAIRLGDAEGARALCGQALTIKHEEALLPRLLETRALAAAACDAFDEALADLERAEALQREGDVRARARTLSLRGFVSLRAGDAVRARELFLQLLDLAETHGLDDLVVNALLNLGAAEQGLSLLGQASGHFERAARLAAAMGRAGTVRTCRANLGLLAVEIGLFDRAERILTQLSEELDPKDPLVDSCALYQLELCLLSELRDEAHERLRVLRERLSKRPLSRAHVELGLFEAQLSVLDGDAKGARARVDAVNALGFSGWDVDLETRRAVSLARAALLEGEAKDAAELLEAAAEGARTKGREADVARTSALLATAYRAASAHTLAAERAARARAIWERMALDLAPVERGAFWAHPERRELASAPAIDSPRSEHSVGFQHLLDITRRLSRSLSMRDVLDAAIDAAIELSGAERGFVLLERHDHAGLEVAVARNFERTSEGRNEVRLSRSIAEQALHSREPVLTIDVGHDQRFSRHASVHAMRLKSVLCLPIIAGATPLGVLYLDTRLKRARLEPRDLPLLTAFAEQLAVALRNAQLVRDLELKTRELSRAKQALEARAEAQAEQIAQLEHELSFQQEALETRYDYAQIHGRSAPMRRMLSLLDRVIDSDLPVMIEGESGTGKELVARATHFQGPRKRAPFVSVNCAALPEALLESELFGHVKGAFTGADRAKQGLFVAARGGTLFLDELGEMPLSMQVKLLRVLTDGNVRPVGATHSIAVDVRIVGATHRDLDAEVSLGRFREDLFYRLSVVRVRVPALRERSEDIVPIAEALLARHAQERGVTAKRLSSEAIRSLLTHPFPGNVRELENALLRACVLATGDTLSSADLGLTQAKTRRRGAASSRAEFERLEAERLHAALEAERWNVSRVARNLGIPRNTLYRKLDKYGLRARASS